MTPQRHRVDAVSIQEFHDNGLLWLANRALHPFGYALAVTAETDSVERPEGFVRIVEENGVRVVRTTDPLGIVFTEQQEDASRAAFFAFLQRRLGPTRTTLIT